MNIGWLVLSRMRMAVRRLCGHAAGGPSGLDAQSYARISAPTSPPAARKSGEAVLLTSSMRAQSVRETQAECRGNLALQLSFMKISESMGNHDSKIVDAGSVG